MRPELTALSRDPSTVRIGGREFLIPWQPAAVWIKHLDYNQVVAVRLVDPQERDVMAEAVLESPDGLEQLWAESRRVLSEQTGRKWWEGLRLLATSVSPEVLGHLTLAGVDPWKVSLGQWCAATYTLCVRDADAKGRLKFDFSLSIPPEGFEDEWDDGADDAENIESAVAKLMG